MQSGRTALHLAVLGRHVDVVNVLLVSGIDVNAVERKVCFLFVIFFQFQVV
jgi:ankyrin repeat protein